MNRLFKHGNYSGTYSEIVGNNPGRAWRDGMISGNGENGFITSGSPYRDTFIYQYMWFNFPSPDPREIPEELPCQLEEARQAALHLDDSWEIKTGGKKRKRTFYYSFHPGHQLRLEVMHKGTPRNYMRWTNYDTAEVGVRYEDEWGVWIRTSFTSRADNVSITRISQSSRNEKINMIFSIDDISGMYKAKDGMSEISRLPYKKMTDGAGDYLIQAAHYPAYENSELMHGGYAGVTRVLTVGGQKKVIEKEDTGEGMNVGSVKNPAIQVTDAEEVYLITASGRTEAMGELKQFASQKEYAVVQQLKEQIEKAVSKYETPDGGFRYDQALQQHTRLHSRVFHGVELKLGNGDDKERSNEELIAMQQKEKTKLLPAFMNAIYNQGRYAQICCAGASAPRLCGMWTGEWNPGWRGIYTLDANVNLQVSAMNTGNVEWAALGYITFILRNLPDWKENARMAYGMQDAIQVSVNSDGDRGMHVEYDNEFPFEYWNAGASWCLLPVYEYWQCNGNRQIPVNPYMRLEAMGAAYQGKERLDLERDILLPILTLQANFWEQLCTPEYYMDVQNNICYKKGKTKLHRGEKYMLIPAYSPENHPMGYSGAITANAAMDIAAARDGLNMVIELEKAVKRKGCEDAIGKWEKLLAQLPDYMEEEDGALKEWSVKEYQENNNHRHLSHLYCAWPACESRKDKKLEKACRQALDNRNRFNLDDGTAGHGWIHKALVSARLKSGDEMVQALLPMVTNEAYYVSLMTDHDTNRRNDTYCTDTALGMLGAVHEALVYSDDKSIELLPALPSAWEEGKLLGLMTRCGVVIDELSWNKKNKRVTVKLTSRKENNMIALRTGFLWKSAAFAGKTERYGNDAPEKLVLGRNETVTMEYELQ